MLTKRLEALLSLIRDASILADVGCDHGLLACEAYKRSLVQKVYAMDVNEKPLKQAIKTIEEYGLEGKVITILSNGFNKLPKDVDTCVIAGVGYETCREILEEDINKTRSLKSIIIQVNRDVSKLRRWANDNKFAIVDEVIVKDGHYYQIMVLMPVDDINYSDIEIDYGPILINKNDEIIVEYLNHLLSKYQLTYQRITSDDQKRKNIKRSIENIEEILKKKS